MILYDFKKNILGFSNVKNKGICLWLLFPVCIDLFVFLIYRTYCSYFNRFFVLFQGFLFWKWAKKYPVGLKPAGLILSFPWHTGFFNQLLSQFFRYLSVPSYTADIIINVPHNTIISHCIEQLPNLQRHQSLLLMLPVVNIILTCHHEYVNCFSTMIRTSKGSFNNQGYCI